MERRNYDMKFEVRSNEEGNQEVVGYAAIFNSDSVKIGGKFVEIIEERAFDEVINDDVVALFNHDQSKVLGRTSAGTLKLSLDKSGLQYRYIDPQTSYSKDLLISIDRGDIKGSSFGFAEVTDKWYRRDDGVVVRSISKIGKLGDVSPVTSPAYETTSVFKRYNEFIDTEQREEKTEETKTEIPEEIKEEIKEIKTPNRNVRELQLSIGLA